MTDVLERYHAMLETPSVLAVDPSALIRDMAAEIERLRAPLRELYEWYDRDGSVGAATDVFEKHRALLAQRIEHEPSKLEVEGSNPSERAAPPLRAREEIARGSRELLERILPLLSAVAEGRSCTMAAGDLRREVMNVLLSRTTGQEWRDISTIDAGEVKP